MGYETYRDRKNVGIELSCFHDPVGIEHIGNIDERTFGCSTGKIKELDASIEQLPEDLWSIQSKGCSLLPNRVSTERSERANDLIWCQESFQEV